MLNIITTKQKFISQLMSSKTTARTCDDVDELVLTYSEMQALATGDPRIKERIELGNKIAELRTVEAAHYANIYKMQDEVINLPPKIAGLKNVAEQAKEDKGIAVREKHDDFIINIGGKLFERADAENVILKEVLKAEVECAKNNGAFEKKLGEYNGFEFGINSYRVLGVIVCELYIKGNLTYKNEASTTEGGRNTTRLEHLVSKGADKKIEETANKIKSLSLDLEVAERNANTPFERSDELKKMVDRMAELDEVFSKQESVIIDDDEEEEDTEISVKNEIDKKDIDNDETPTQKPSQNNTQNKHRR